MDALVYKKHTEPFTFRRFSHLSALPVGMHEEIEVLFVRKGQVSMGVNGRKISLFPGDMLFNTPFTYHEFHESGDAPISFDALIFRPEICPGLGPLLPAAFPKDSHIPKERLNAMTPMLFNEVVDFVLRKKEEDGFSGNESAGHFDFGLSYEEIADLGPYLTVLTLELAKLVEFESEEMPDFSLLRKILRYLADHFTEDVSRDTLADACHVTPNSISRVFSEIGTSFREYLNSLRVTRAYSLLTTTDLPIREVMIDSGYYNQGTFNQNFLARFKKTPREIREKQ